MSIATKTLSAAVETAFQEPNLGHRGYVTRLKLDLETGEAYYQAVHEELATVMDEDEYAGRVLRWDVPGGHEAHTYVELMKELSPFLGVALDDGHDDYSRIQLRTRQFFAEKGRRRLARTTERATSTVLALLSDDSGIELPWSVRVQEDDGVTRIWVETDDGEVEAARLRRGPYSGGPALDV